jgi:hypothetical protein
MFCNHTFPKALDFYIGLLRTPTRVDAWVETMVAELTRHR